jgi:putative ABC transport system permease protein
LTFGQHAYRTGVTGVPPNTRLNRALDRFGRPLPLPPDGLLLSAKLAEILHAKPGDQVWVEVQEGRRPRVLATVQGLITDYSGLSAYMDIDALRHLMREGGTISGAHIALDARQRAAFMEAVKEAPRIASLGIKDSVRDSFRKTTAESISLMQGLYFTFSVIVAFGVVYNSARIALSERSRDLATLRVIGFTNREVAAVLIGELAMLTLVALPLGLGVGAALATWIVSAASTETIRMPLILSPHTFSVATLIVVTSALVSFALVSRRIRKLDLLGVLKARD